MAIPQPDTRAAQPVQPAEPVLTSKWRRVEAMPAREMLVELETDEGEGPDDWEEDEVEYVALEFGNHLPADLLAEHDELRRSAVVLPCFLQLHRRQTFARLRLRPSRQH